MNGFPNLRFTHIVLALTFALPACTTSEVLYVDARFSATEQADIQAASDEWARATGVGVDLVFGADISHESFHRVMVRDASPDELEDHARTNFDTFPTIAGNTHVWHGPFGVTGERLDILVPRLPLDADGQIDRYNFRVLVMHEFGHHLGMPGHVDDPHALMNGVHAGSPCVTHADAVGFCAAIGCNAASVEVCR